MGVIFRCLLDILSEIRKSKGLKKLKQKKE